MENVALTDSLPLSGSDNNYVYDAEGHPRDARQEGFIGTARTVSPGYFATLGMPLTSGRLLTEQDNSGTSRAAVINEEMAERLWPHQNPLGKHINSVKNEQIPGVWDPNQASALVVVGVVGNAREGSLAAGFGDEVYLPMDRANEQPVMYALLRTQAGAAQAAEVPPDEGFSPCAASLAATIGAAATPIAAILIAASTR